MTNDRTAPFDWAGLTRCLPVASIACDDHAAVAAYLRTRIEAAFVPVERHARELFDATAHGELKTLEATARAEAAEAEVRRLDYSTTHTCWDGCPRLPCTQRREIEALTAQLAEARESERAAAERHEGLVRALDAEAVAKDVARAAALSDLIAECAVLLDGGK